MAVLVGNLNMEKEQQQTLLVPWLQGCEEDEEGHFAECSKNTGELSA